MRANFVRFYPICEILVISPNKDRKDGATEQM